jgi:hypothetical protein
MLEATTKVRRKTGILISGVLVWVAVAGLTSACSRKRPGPPPLAPVAKAHPPSDSQRPTDARPFPDPTFLILVWMETTPPGAAVRRLSDGHVMGFTPDTIEFGQSAEPVLVRFELAGYVPVTRTVPVLEDGQVSVVLEPIPKGRGPAAKKSKGSKGQ